MHRRRRQNLGDLPESLQTERQGGRVFDPTSGLGLDWVNRFQTTNFGVILGAESQTVLQDNALRTYLLIQNQSAAIDLFLSFTTDASIGPPGSILIIPRGNYELIGGQDGGSFVPKNSVNLLAAAPGVRVTIVEGTLLPYELSTRME